MVEILLFHHALGLTSGVRAFADRLSENGHTVHVPDLYRGRIFAGITAGVEYGADVVGPRGRAAADELPHDLVYAGFSLGAMPAQQLAQTRPGARGALLFSSCAPFTEFSPSWPDDVPVQIHAMTDDELFVAEGDITAARTLEAEAEDAELYLYPGDAHLFADSGLPSYDPETTDTMVQHVLRFLERIG